MIGSQRGQIIHTQAKRGNIGEQNSPMFDKFPSGFSISQASRRHIGCTEDRGHEVGIRVIELFS